MTEVPARRFDAVRGGDPRHAGSPAALRSILRQRVAGLRVALLAGARIPSASAGAVALGPGVGLPGGRQGVS